MRDKKVGASGKHTSLLVVFGSVLLSLVFLAFAAVAVLLPMQIGRSLDEGFRGDVLPAIQSAFTEFEAGINKQLDAKLQASVQRQKDAFVRENEAKARALIKSIMPMLDAFDYEAAEKIIEASIGSDTSLLGIRYRFDKKASAKLMGADKGEDFMPVAMSEKSDFADAEITLLVKTAGLKKGEQEEHESFSAIVAQVKTTSEKMQSDIGANTDRVREGILSALVVKVWVIASVSCALVMLVSLFILQHVVITPLRLTREYLLRMSEGDFSKDFAYQSNTEIGEMADAMNVMTSNMRRIANSILASANALAGHAGSLSETTERLVEGASRQASEASQVSGAMTQLSASFTEVASHAAEASGTAKNSSTQAESGRRIVEETAQGISRTAETVTASTELIEELGRNGEKIGHIISVIDEIAKQTNLLALNAAIEAARAGEQGRGFAVVADEVRTLAARTGQATLEISRMIEQIQSDTARSVTSMRTGNAQVDQGVALTRQACEALNQVVLSSDESMELIRSIATSVEEQSSVAQHVSSSVNRIADVIGATEGSSIAIRKSAEQLTDLSRSLSQTISWFAVGASK